MGMYPIAEQNFNKRDPLIVEKNVYSVAIYHVGCLVKVRGCIFQHLFWPVSNRYVLRIKRGGLRGLAPPNTVFQFVIFILQYQSGLYSYNLFALKLIEGTHSPAIAVANRF